MRRVIEQLIASPRNRFTTSSVHVKMIEAGMEGSARTQAALGGAPRVSSKRWLTTLIGSQQVLNKKGPVFAKFRCFHEQGSATIIWCSVLAFLLRLCAGRVFAKSFSLCDRNLWCLPCQPASNERAPLLPEPPIISK